MSILQSKHSSLSFFFYLYMMVMYEYKTVGTDLSTALSSR